MQYHLRPVTRLYCVELVAFPFSDHRSLFIITIAPVYWL